MSKAKIQTLITKMKYYLDLKAFFTSFILSFIWIYTSDYIVFAFSDEAIEHKLYQNFKGTAYVFLFSLVLAMIYKREKRYQHLLLQNKRQNMIGEYASIIVHEVKNPLTSISLSLDLIKRKSSDKLTMKAVETSGQSIKSLKETISLLQILSRGEEVNSKTLQQNISPYYQVDSIFSLVKKLQSKKNIIYSNQIPQELSIKGNQSLCLHLFMNLIKNAFEYIESSKLREGEITVSYHSNSLYHHFKVENSGEPIPYETQEVLFTNFTTKGEKAGTGLGLIFCKQVMNLHNGKIIYNKKTNHPCFDIYFPKHI